MSSEGMAMGFLGLCKGDPLVDTLRETLGANPVRRPESRVETMKTIAVRDGRHVLNGTLEGILAGSPRITLPEHAKAVSQMADLTHRKSLSVKVELGLEILGNFLSGLGVPMTPGIRAEFENAKEVAFSFSEVSRTWVDGNWLGRALKGKVIDSSNPRGRIYLDKPPWQLLLIDSVIQSKSLTIGVTKSSGGSGSLDVEALQGLIGSAGITVSATSEDAKELTFLGSQSLTFAFTAVQLHLSNDGAIFAAPPASESALLSVSGDEQLPAYGLDHVELCSSPAMVDLEEMKE